MIEFECLIKRMGLNNFMKYSAMVLKCCIVFKLRIFSYMDVLSCLKC